MWLKVQSELSRDADTGAGNWTMFLRLPEFSETPDGERTDCWVWKTVVQQLQGVNGWEVGPLVQQAHHLDRKRCCLVG